MISISEKMSGDGSSSPLIRDTITNPNSSDSAKRKRNLVGNPDPDAEIIALSPRSLMATNRFVCEICSKGFQRDQNLQLHKRGHNLPWKLKQRNKQDVVRKKYICPETSCVHHHPSRALGDLTGVKKHFSRKHGEKKWKCEKCSKKYAVQSDLKAHSKICGTKEYRCDCGTLFSRKDSFITHRAFCDPLLEENSRVASFSLIPTITNLNFQTDLITVNGGGSVMNDVMKPRLPIWLNHNDNNPLENTTTSSSFLGSSCANNNNGMILSSEMVQCLSKSHKSIEDFTNLPQGLSLNPSYNNYGGCSNSPPPPPHTSATALLQKVPQIGFTRSTNSSGSVIEPYTFRSLHQSENSSGGMLTSDRHMMSMMAGLLTQKTEGIDSNDENSTRDFLGVEENERRIFSLQQELMKFTCWMNDSSIGFNGDQ